MRKRTLNDLPTDILIKIASQLNANDSYNLRRTHSFFYQHTALKKQLKEASFNIVMGESHAIVYHHPTKRWYFIGQDFNNTNLKQLVEKIHLPILKIYTYAHKVFFLCENQIYVYGMNNKGDLGLAPTIERILVPTEINFNIDILDIVLGYDFSFIIDKKYNVYAFGNNEQGEAGLNESYQNVSTPIKLIFSFKVILK